MNLDRGSHKILKLFSSVPMVILLVLALTIGEIYLTASVFDFMDWPLFHTWRLVHGSILFIFPVYLILSVIGVLLVGKFLAGKLRRRQKQGIE